jgi:glycosyltransferase involved in cell wall biosynthesis
MMELSRTVWILGPGRFAGIRLGPTLRIFQMASRARDLGLPVVIALEDGEDGCEEGIVTRRLDRRLLHEIKTGDALIATATMHPRIFMEILRLRIPFDLDLYGLGALEHIELNCLDNSRKQFQSRRRLLRRYRILTRAAERIYLSNTQQMLFLGGAIFSAGTSQSAHEASRLPEKCMLVPMGCTASPVESVIPQNPYPLHLQQMPIFLWGGGIWKWFDLDNLLNAFSILEKKNSKARLFFLTSTNPSGSPSQDAPVRRAIQLASDLGILNVNTFFPPVPISPNQLPGYLSHCHAGVMANPIRLESYGSWRTRLLDLLPYGKPIISAGFDPLSHSLSMNGACISVPPSHPEYLAQAIEKLCVDPDHYAQYSKEALVMAFEHSWEITLKEWLIRIQDKNTFREKYPSQINIDAFLFVFGL